MITTEKPISNRIQTRKSTSARRKKLRTLVLSFNIQNNHLSKQQKQDLTLLFKESKYYYNYLLNLSQQTIVDDFGNLIYINKIQDIDTKNNNITLYNSLTHETFNYELKLLSSQIKQKIRDKALDNIKGLSAVKSKGRKTGKLKFKSQVNVPLKQFNNTYYLDDDFKYLSIQGLNSHFKLHQNKALTKLSKELGFNKLSIQDLIQSKVIEIANAEIIKSTTQLQPTFKFNLTVYLNPIIHTQYFNIKKFQEDYSILKKIESTDMSKWPKPRLNKNRLSTEKIKLKQDNKKSKVSNKNITLNKLKNRN